MEKPIQKTEEDPQIQLSDPCADAAQAQKTHPKRVVEVGPIYRIVIPKNIPPDIP